MSNSGGLYRIKLAVLTAMTLGGSALYGTSCGMADLRDNLAAGTLSYVKTSTTEFWSALIPKWSTMIQQQGT